MKTHVKLFFAVLTAVAVFSCSTQEGSRFSSKPLPQRANVAIIIDGPNKVRNFILGKFMENGFNVKAVNASDLLSPSDVYDIRDFKKSADESFPADSTIQDLEKAYSNIFKLHVYNYELHKAEILSKIRTTFDVQYLVLLNLSDWQEVSWGRVIDLRTFELIWVENYPTKYEDTLDSVIDHLIESATSR